MTDLRAGLGPYRRVSKVKSVIVWVGLNPKFNSYGVV